MRAELQTALALARILALKEIPSFLGELEEIRVTATARLVAPAPTEQPDELLSVEETARRMGVSKDYLYHAHKRFPFARRIGKRLLFSSSGLDSYLKKSR